MKVVHFGAGNIGRGLIGKVLYDSGFQIVFVDTNIELISQINQSNSYKICYIEEPNKIDIVKNVTAIDGKQLSDVKQEILSADIITTSVGVNNLKYVAKTLKAVIPHLELKNIKIPILANENTVNASQILLNELKNICSEIEINAILEKVQFINTAIDRQSLSLIRDGEQMVMVEQYLEWVIEDFDSMFPLQEHIQHATFVDNLEPFIERKLYIVNAEHAAFAYLGQLFGYETVQEAAQDSDIKKLVQDMLIERIAYFKKAYKMVDSDLMDFIYKTISRHTHPNLHDEVTRVGRNPIRKLGPKDRLIGPLQFMNKWGMDYQASAKIIAAALFYHDESDEEAVILQSMLKDNFGKNLEDITKLPAIICQEIEQYYWSIKKDVKSIF